MFRWLQVEGFEPVRPLIRAAPLVAGLSLWGATKPHPVTGGKDCLACHGPIQTHKVLHAPVKENACDACHQIPAGGGAAALTERPEKLCLVCHDGASFTAAYVHGPAAVGACTACHDPHGSEAPHLARTAGQALCFSCHAEMQANLANARYQHKALERGCTGCHSPHASPLKYQLKAALPGLCVSCHGSVEQTSKAAVKHAPVQDQRSCLNCHDPHRGDHRPQLKADGLATCLNCHNQKLEVKGVELADMRRLLAENPDHHGPIRDKNCAGCHQPHGSAYFRLLSDEYPKEFYAPYRPESFALCFRCHDSAIPREERTTSLTDFRDGDRNLHFVHVNKPTKGRTCRACHETHASTFPNHIRKSVPFGRWELPVNFTKTATGGSCAPGCHTPKSYDRGIGTQAKKD